MKIKIIVTICLFTALCSHSYGADKIILPPVPDNSKNSKTILGIDSNKNRVRDDVEIFIFDELGKRNSKLFHAYLKYAESITMTLTKSQDEKALYQLYDQRTSDRRCINSLENSSGDDTIRLINKINNSEERKKAMNIAGSNTKKYSSPDVPKDKWKTLCR